MKKIIWNAITYINRTLTVIISVCAFLISNLDASKSPPPFLQDLLLKTQDFLKGNAWWIIVYSIGVQFTLWLVKKFFLSDPKLNEAITAALDNARTFLIDEKYHHTDPEHHHRVTLFKHTSFCYRPRPLRSYWWFWGRCSGKKMRSPFSGWLVPVARSGHTTKKVRSVFLAPDDAEHSEGIAGKAWSQSGPIYKNDLIELHLNSNDTNVGRYSKACFIDPQWTRRRLINKKPRARSYLGFKINLSDQAWGVIVVDSTRPDGVKKSTSFTATAGSVRIINIKSVKKGGFMSTNWLALDTQKLFAPKQELIEGVKVNVFLPANLIPVALKGSLESDSKIFTIEFKYIGHFVNTSEEKQCTSDDGVVSFFADVHTGRITKITVNTAKLATNKIEVEITEVLSNFEKKEPYTDSNFFKASMKIIKEAVQMQPDVFHAAAI